MVADGTRVGATPSRPAQLPRRQDCARNDMTFCRFHEGGIAEEWIAHDNLWMIQIGIMAHG
ncbi:MAG: hypothetical protein JWN69_127 [Alphaproteobacteria bacterium]|nr:hypothetical protein [Alphaproteobacteria bacterium]